MRVRVRVRVRGRAVQAQAEVEMMELGHLLVDAERVGPEGFRQVGGVHRAVRHVHVPLLGCCGGA